MNGTKVSSLVLSIATAFFVVTGVRAAQKVVSTPSDRPISLDGDPADWAGVPAVFLEDSLHNLSVAHDEDSFYLMFRFSDRELARQIMRRGVTLWFNGNGKTKNKNEEFGVRYAGSQQIFDSLDSGEFHGDGWKTVDTDSSGRAYPPLELTSLRPKPGQLTVIRTGIKDSIDEAGSGGLGASSHYGDETFCYELRVPFADIGGKVADSQPSAKRQVAVGIEIGGLTSAEREMLRSVKRDRGDDIDKRPSGITGGTFGARRGGPGKAGSQDLESRWRMEAEIHWLVLTLPSRQQGTGR